MIAGPSEILVVADGQNDPAWIAADLLSQCEHDPAAQAILITDDAAFADAVARAAQAHLRTLPRAAIAGESWERHGALITVADLDEAVGLVDRIAPEHLEVALDIGAAEAFSVRVHHAGAIFIGRHTPEAVGDYVGGPNHVLPTARSARFSSGLGVHDFLKRTSILSCGPEGLRAIGPAAMTLAHAEGLHAHALSVALRLNMPPR
jgi:histidinol dehydrogenase